MCEVFNSNELKFNEAKTQSGRTEHQPQATNNLNSRARAQVNALSKRLTGRRQQLAKLEQRLNEICTRRIDWGSCKHEVGGEGQVTGLCGREVQGGEDGIDCTLYELQL